jgi:hypothetical protein
MTTSSRPLASEVLTDPFAALLPRASRASSPPDHRGPSSGFASCEACSDPGPDPFPESSLSVHSVGPDNPRFAAKG